MRQLLLALALLPLAAVVAANGPAPYSARDTLERAQIGTFSPRLDPPIRIEEPRAVDRPRTDRLECREDLTKRLVRTIVCEPQNSTRH